MKHRKDKRIKQVQHSSNEGMRKSNKKKNGKNNFAKEMQENLPEVKDKFLG